MTRPNAPDSTDAWRSSIERRLKALEVGGRAEHTSIQGGGFRVLDVDGDERVKIGDLNDNGAHFGVRVIDEGIIEIVGGGSVVVGDDFDAQRVFLGLLAPGVYGLRVLADGVIQLVQGGAMTIGDEDGDTRITIGDPGNTGDYSITVDDGGSITVNDGGEMVVNDGGSVTVNDGGGVMVNDGGAVQVVEGGAIQVVEGGVITVGDAGGEGRIIIGDSGADGNYGITVADEDGNRRFGIDNEGLHDPWLGLHVRDPGDSREVPGGGFTPIWQATAPAISHKGLLVAVNWQADAGVTGSIRIGSSAGDSDAVAVDGGGGGASGSVQFAWLHPYDLGASGGATFNIEANKGGVPGSLVLYEPAYASLVSPEVCTAGGT